MNLKSSWSSDHELFSLPSATLRVVSSQRVGESILRLSLRRPSAPVASPPPCLPPSPVVAQVPEPGSLAVLGLLSGLVAVRRRR